MSRSEAPPVEAITGLRVVAIFSIRNQSRMSELASLRMSTPNSTALSTEVSSNGVTMVSMLWARTALTIVLSESQGIWVAMVFLM